MFSVCPRKFSKDIFYVAYLYLFSYLVSQYVITEMVILLQHYILFSILAFYSNIRLLIVVSVEHVIYCVGQTKEKTDVYLY